MGSFKELSTLKEDKDLIFERERAKRVKRGKEKSLFWREIVGFLYTDG